MSGSIIGGVIGAVIGGLTTESFQGAMYGWMIGSAAGGIVMPPDLGTQYGPRLSDLKFEQSQYGSPIPITYGTVALQGSVIWAKDIKEVQTETDTGGKGGPTQTTVNYSYYGSFAIALCEGPNKKVLRIWAGLDKRLIYDGVTLEGGQVRFYPGSQTQMPDPLMEADKGVGMTPAYRGIAYAVFEDFPLAKDGNRLPLLTFEVSTDQDGGTCGIDYVTVGTPPNDGRLYANPPVKLGNMGVGKFAAWNRKGALTDNAGNIYILAFDGSGQWYLKRVSWISPIQEDLLPLPGGFDHGRQSRMAYDPNANQIGIINGTAFALVDCGNFAVVATSAFPLSKTDIVFSLNEGQFRFMNEISQLFATGHAHPDDWGIPVLYGGGELIECGSHGIAAVVYLLDAPQTYLNGALLTNIEATFYDPVRDRLVALTGGGFNGLTGYYDFTTGATVIPAVGGNVTRAYVVYSPMHDRVFYSNSSGQIAVMNPANFSAESFADECVFTGGRLYYDETTPVQQNGFALQIVPLPGVRNRIAVIQNYDQSDIYAFAAGVNGKGATLADVVADLSERAGESRYDVTQLEKDIVDGYVIARQMTVQAAIQALRTVYYFDGVESQGVIRFVKRGGKFVTVIDDADLAAHDGGSEPPDPLATVRKMENELPRSVTVKYLLAATDYEQATKQTQRLIGAGGDEQTIEVPLVMSEGKAQEVAEVNLTAAWAERISYTFAISRKYSDLEPTDLVLVKRNLMRLTSIKASPNGILECSALADESDFYNRDVVTGSPSSGGSGGLVSGPGTTRLELF